jgi:hypothetical protein
MSPLAFSKVSPAAAFLGAAAGFVAGACPGAVVAAVAPCAAG